MWEIIALVIIVICLIEIDHRMYKIQKVIEKKFGEPSLF